MSFRTPVRAFRSLFAIQNGNPFSSLDIVGLFHIESSLRSSLRALVRFPSDPSDKVGFVGRICIFCGPRGFLVLGNVFLFSSPVFFRFYLLEITLRKRIQKKQKLFRLFFFNLAVITKIFQGVKNKNMPYLFFFLYDRQGFLLKITKP